MVFLKKKRLMPLKLQHLGKKKNQSSYYRWERRVKVQVDDFPLPFKDTPGFKYFAFGEENQVDRF